MTERSAELFVVAGLLVAVWLAMLVVLLAVFRTRRPRTGPMAFEPPDDLRPAVVALITNDWQLPRRAVAATLFDLAARGIVSIEAGGPGKGSVRIPSRRAERGLTAFEQMVFDHVRGQTVNGVVPLEALTTGPRPHASAWWRDFRSKVVDHTRARGLSRPRWPTSVRLLLYATAGLAGVLTGIGIVLTPGLAESEYDQSGVSGFVAGTAIIGGALGWLAHVCGGERDTAGGLAAATRWLGFRRHLLEQPPVDERFLPWAAALGAAPKAVGAVPTGAESSRRAWSGVGGDWRMVRVRYRWVFPPGWGLHPAIALLWGLGPIAALAFLAAVTGVSTETLADLLDEQGTARYAAVAVGVLLGLLLVRSLLLIALSLPDLWQRRTVQGRVVRRRVIRDDEKTIGWWVAIDDGTQDRIRAWRTGLHISVSQGSWVEAVVTPRLGYVVSLEDAPAECPLPVEREEAES